MARTDPFDLATHLLGASSWANLGLWPAPSYDAACAALAAMIAEAARLDSSPSVRLLDLACGSGASLALWRDRFGVRDLTAIELSPARAARARALVPEACVLTGPALPLPVPGPFTHLVCVDAAYHLGPVASFARAAFAALAPGGRLALSTLTAPRLSPLPRLLRGAHIPRGAVLPADALRHALAAAGFVDLALTPLDAAVLEGFAEHVAARATTDPRPSLLDPGWRKIALTAALARWGLRARALGYTLVSARRPLTRP